MQGYFPDRRKKSGPERAQNELLTVKERVIDVILCLNLDYNLDKDKVNKEANFNDLGMNSLDKLDLITEIEKEFDIKIPVCKLTNMQTVKDLVKLVEIELSKN